MGDSTYEQGDRGTPCRNIAEKKDEAEPIRLPSKIA